MIVSKDCPEEVPAERVPGLKEQVIPAGAEGHENETAAASGAPIAARVRVVVAELPDKIVTDACDEVSENGPV